MPFFHVWFSTKKRKWLLQGEIAVVVKRLIESTALEKGSRLLECEPMVDHVHLLLKASGKAELPWLMKLLKSRSAYELFKAEPELKLDFGTNSLWQTSFNARMVSQSQVATVRRYIRTQDQRLEKYER